MLAFSDIIDFLLRLMARRRRAAQFDQDPQGTLAAAGLEGVTGRTSATPRLQLADSGCGLRHGRGRPRRTRTRPRRRPRDRLHHARTTSPTRTSARRADPSRVDHGSTLVTIDDRDTLFFQSISDDDVTLTDNSVQRSPTPSTRTTPTTRDRDPGQLRRTPHQRGRLVQHLRRRRPVAIQDNDVNSGDDPITVDTGVPADPAVDGPDGSAGREPDRAGPTPPTPTGPTGAAADDDLPDGLRGRPARGRRPGRRRHAARRRHPGTDDTPADDAADLVPTARGGAS